MTRKNFMCQDFFSMAENFVTNFFFYHIMNKNLPSINQQFFLFYIKIEFAKDLPLECSSDKMKFMQIEVFKHIFPFRTCSTCQIYSRMIYRDEFLWGNALKEEKLERYKKAFSGKYP
jgi:hypothetical protein